MKARRAHQSAFTLVEILIVVIILGILAAIVIPQFTNASQDARKNSLTSQLQTVRSQIELYKLQHLDQLPPALKNGGVSPDCWAEMTERTAADGTTTNPQFGPYFQAPPTNPLNGWSNVGLAAADYGSGGISYSNTSGADGFVIDPNTGKIWATSAKGTFIYNEGNPSDTNNDQ